MENTPKNVCEILTANGIDPDRVLLIRHSDNEKNFKKCQKANMVFEYTQVQSSDRFHKKAGNADYWMVFINGVSTNAVYYALYTVEGSRPATPDLMPEGYPCPEMFDRGEIQYILKESDKLKEYKGKLVINWGKSSSACRMWAQSAGNGKEKPVVSIDG